MGLFPECLREPRTENEGEGEERCVCDGKNVETAAANNRTGGATFFYTFHSFRAASGEGGRKP